MSDFIFLGYKITVDGDRSHEIKTLTPWIVKLSQRPQPMLAYLSVTLAVPWWVLGAVRVCPVVVPVPW